MTEKPVTIGCGNYKILYHGETDQVTVSHYEFGAWVKKNDIVYTEAALAALCSSYLDLSAAHKTNTGELDKLRSKAKLADRLLAELDREKLIKLLVDDEVSG